MHRLQALSLSLLLTLSLTVNAFASDPFGVKSVLGTPDTPADCVISVAADEVLEFSAEDLERRMGLGTGELGGITVTALPLATQGGFYLDGVELEPYDFLDRPALDRLCFVPGDKAINASLTFLPQSPGGVSTSMTIQILNSVNQPPDIEDGVLETAINIAKTGNIAASDPEGGSLSIQLVTKPAKGEVTFDGLSFTYRPYKDMWGSDQFTVFAVDNAGAYSREATIYVEIDKSNFTFSYADLGSSPCAYAALMLQQTGIYTGEQVGNSYFFHPDRQMTRADFIIFLLSSCGLDTNLPVTVNTGLPNDNTLPGWLKPYLRVAIDEGILSGEQAFHPNEIPTRAEAVVLTDRAAKIRDVKDYELTLPDLGAIPDWAIPSYKDLAAYKMLDLHTGYALPDAALTNSYAADLCWQLYKHTHR